MNKLNPEQEHPLVFRSTHGAASATTDVISGREAQICFTDGALLLTGPRQECYLATTVASQIALDREDGQPSHASHPIWASQPIRHRPRQAT